MKKILAALIAFLSLTSVTHAQCDATFTYTNIDCDSVWFVPASFGPQYTYQWSFGDGNVSTLPSPTHVYAADGNYTAYLVLNDTVSGCSDILTIPININCISPCSVTSAWTYLTDSTGCDVSFVSTVSGINWPYSYFWDFGDGNTSTLSNPNHTYVGFQTYNVCLTVTDVNGCDTTMCMPVPAGCAATSCDATFTYTHIDCDSVWFVPATTGPQYTYQWNFGDGNISYDSSPTHVYSSNGTYSVYLVIQDTVSGCTDILTVPITINCGASCNVAGAWTWLTDSLGCEATFVSTAFGGTAPYSYFWDFGDGSNSTQANPTHAYSPLGPWDVCLTISDANGCDTTYCQWITAGCAATSCDATFTYAHIDCDSVWFVPASFGPQYTYQWNFGDGNVSTHPTPTHVYTADGTYLVYLVLQDTVSGCTDILTMPVNINCGASCTTNGAFAYNVDPGNCDVYFVPTAFGGTPPYTYYWDFGDGSYSSSSNPIHNYPNGSTWTPCLTITDANGCDTTICNVVTVNCTPTSCDAVFTFTYLDCNELYFFPASSGPQYNYLWDFGDGTTSTQMDPTHSFADGTHIVFLTVIDSLSGCSDTYWYTLLIDCGYSPCNTNGAISWSVDTSNCKVQFVSTAFGGTPPYTYYWSFGDGSFSTTPNPLHQYPNNSAWTPCLTITDANGCDTTICEVITVACNSVNCDATHTHTHVSCDSVWFVPVVQDPSFNYYWDFGDGNFSTEISPVHPYTANGTYTVVLYISDSLNGCSDTYTTVVNVSCGATPCNVDAVITWASDSTDCSVYMVSSVWGGQAPYTYYWTFGDGHTSSNPHPTHQYPGVGPWTPCLTVTDANGCDTVVCMFVAPLCTSGMEEVISFDIEVFPNPSTGLFNLLLPDEADITICDLSGKLIFIDNNHKADGYYPLDLSGYTDGIYILKVSTAFGIATEKLIKE